MAGQVENDCLSCRLVSGFGVIGIGLYIYAQAKNRKSTEANIMKILAAGTALLGTARLFNMKFLKANKNSKQ